MCTYSGSFVSGKSLTRAVYRPIELLALVLGASATRFTPESRENSQHMMQLTSIAPFHNPRDLDTALLNGLCPTLTYSAPCMVDP